MHAKIILERNIHYFSWWHMNITKPKVSFVKHGNSRLKELRCFFLLCIIHLYFSRRLMIIQYNTIIFIGLVLLVLLNFPCHFTYFQIFGSLFKYHMPNALQFLWQNFPYFVFYCSYIVFHSSTQRWNEMLKNVQFKF